MSQATLHTNHGPVKLELFDEDAPKTVDNFLKLSRDGYYDGLIFHRVIKDFMIQGGCPGGPAPAVGYEFEDEINQHKIVRGARRWPTAGRTPTAASSSSSPRTRRPGSTASTRCSAASSTDGLRRLDQEHRTGHQDRPADQWCSRRWRSMRVELLWWDGCPSHPERSSSSGAC